MYNGKEIRKVLKKAAEPAKKPNPYGKDVSQYGYRDDSPYRDSPYLNIFTPDGIIDMTHTGVPIMADDRYLPPYSGMHSGFGERVLERPLAQNGREVKSYNPNLAAQDIDFQNWYSKNTLEGQRDVPFSDKLDYDYYSFYKSGKKGNIQNHFPDTFKRPGHETFSDESIYSIPENPGGHWFGDIYNAPITRVKGKFAYGGDPSLSDLTGHYQKGGRTPIYVNDPNDPRLKTYNDSLSAFNEGESDIQNSLNIFKNKYKETDWKYDRSENLSQESKDLHKEHGRLIKGILPAAHKIYTSNAQNDTHFFEEYKKPVQPVEYKKDYVTRQVSFGPYGNIMNYYDAVNKIIRSEPYALTSKEMGGWLDELDEEYKRGGIVNPLMKARSKRAGTSKNIQSSINKLFLRNYDLFGPGGKNIYNPNSKYQDGGQSGWLDNLE